jgi:mono/diheme cytochrome c family protein
MKFGKSLILLTIVGAVLLLWPKLKPTVDKASYTLSELHGVPYEEVSVTWPEQNWTQDQWDWWYHVSQGSALESIIPYDWFINMEQPGLGLFGSAGDFIDQDYLGQFGFLPDGSGDYYNPKYNPDNLPVGFTKTENYFDPIAGEIGDVVGFTCAACHTGQINYKGEGLRIEGGPNMIDVGKFKVATGISLLLTDKLPWRFNRFARGVLGEDYSKETKADLKRRLDTLLADAGKVQKDTGEFYAPEKGVQEGFGRLDALDRIGNFVFGLEINLDNFHAVDAPVNYPHLWTAPWFDWVQYNGSVMQPMTRNAGEAMGVFARVNFDPENTDRYALYDSNVDVDNLHAIEELLAGDPLYDVLMKPEEYKMGLKGPAWPEAMLGAIDQEKAAKGKILYENKCQGCHLAPIGTEAFLAEKNWVTLNDGKEPPLEERKYLKVTMKNLYDIGTDEIVATNWARRLVNLKTLASDHDTVGKCKAMNLEPFECEGKVTAGFALPFTVDEVVQYQYDKLELPPEKQREYDGFRPDKARAPLGYKARPLDGIWATAPFLHNGSVPNLYEMFVPADQRTKQFYLGSREFDPELVGFNTSPIKGGFLLDTTTKANSNAGHEFKGDGTGPGVVGPQLTEDERWALVEYLKTL